MTSTQEAQPAVKDGLEPMEVEQVGPPEWRSVLNFSHDLGYPDFFPSRPGFNQPEDVVTPVNVRQGFQGANVVAAGVESVSVHAAILDRLKKQNIFKNVDALAMEILNARRDNAPKFPESTYKLPNRVVYNETMKKSFLNDLADERIPLNSPKFAKSVPHGMKGQDLLEMLWTRRIGVDRAVWLVQVLGAHDVQNLRKAYDPMKTPFPPNQQYSISFTEAIVGFMNKQLAEFVIAPQKNESGKASANPETLRKQLWAEKWDYSQELLGALFEQHLLDQRTYGLWLRDSLLGTPFAKLPFILDQLGRSTSLLYEDLMIGSCIVAAAVNKLSEVVRHRARTALQSIERRLVELVRIAWCTDPQLFFFPHYWRKQEALLREVLLGSGDSIGLRQFAAVRVRNLRSLWNRKQPSLGVSDLERAREEALGALPLLEHYEAAHSLAQLTLRYFLSSKQEIALEFLRSKFDVLLDWSIKRYSISTHRPYLAAALIEEALRQPGVFKVTQDSWIESYLFNWIDHACEAFTGDIADAARTLVAEFFNREIVSFDAYLARSMALGRTFRHSTPTNSVGKFLDFINSLQLVNLSQSAITLQRNITHGFDNEHALEEYERQRQQALGCYLDQSQKIDTAKSLQDCILDDVPAILLEQKEFPSFNRCCHLLGEFLPVPMTLDSALVTIRLYLLVHVLERRKDYRLLVELLDTQWRRLGLAVSKPVAEAIQRHGCLISCFRDERPELCAALFQFAKQPPSTRPNHMTFADINRKPTTLRLNLPETLEKLRSASDTQLDQETIANLWKSSLDSASLQTDPDVKNDTVSILAQIWRNVAHSSLPAWKAHLASWVVDDPSDSALYQATSELGVQLVVHGVIEPIWLLEKLVYPHLDSPTQMQQNGNHLQQVAILCIRILAADNVHIRNMEDMVFRSAVSAKPIMAGYGNPPAMTAFLQHLPCMLLLADQLTSEVCPHGVEAIVTSPRIRELVMRHENRIKHAFTRVLTEWPERRAFWTSSLSLLLANSKEEGTTPDIASTDWRELATCAPGSQDTVSDADLRLSLPQAKAIVDAASRLILSGSISMWWKMCASPPQQEVFLLHIAACTLIFDAISSEGIVTREALRQIESYCFVMEIARSVQPALEALSPDHVDTHCGILQDLVVRVEGLVRLIPVDLLERLICLMTSVICFAADTDHAETQLRLLRIIDSSVHADAEWAIDFMLLHFQVMRPDKRAQLLLWLEGSTLITKPASRRYLAVSESNWEAPPVDTEPNGYPPHRRSFTRLTEPTNNGSLSLLQFGAVLTGDRCGSVDKQGPWSQFVSERDVGINPTGESFYLRNSVSGLSRLDDDGMREQQDVGVEEEMTEVTQVPETISPSRPKPRKRVKLDD